MTLWYGGDYNPEQWPEAVWDDDIQLMLEARITVVTVGVFSWARLEPTEGVFDFAWLDTVIDKLHAAGIKVDLATATASPPPWVARAYPDTLPVREDGMRFSIGSRQHYSPHSAQYRRLAARLVRAIAERYGKHPAIIAWHVNNEYGCHVSRCYSDEGATAFRAWLLDRYGSIEQLNVAWGTDFWAQRYGSFDEIEPPRAAPTTRNPTQLLDFDRFSSDALMNLYRMEVQVLRELSPGVPITTNFMGAFKPLDYWAWAREVDFVSHDSYPDPADPDSLAHSAMTHDLMRSLRGGQSWMLMEQATSAVNWRPRNAVKPAGSNRLVSLQSIARGSDGAMHFQWRQSRAGAEKFHSAMVPFAGTDTRIFREVVALGDELSRLGHVVGDRVDARVAIVIDWDSWWAIEQSSLPTRIDYQRTIFDWYQAFFVAGVTVDFVQPSSDLGGYALVVAPALFCVSSDGLRALGQFAANGGTLLVSYLTGIVDQNNHLNGDGFLGALQNALGVRIEEFAPFAHPDEFGQASAEAPTSTITGAITGGVSLWAEFLHVDEAEVLATFSEGPVAGWPAITRRSFDNGGSAWYSATQPGDDSMKDLLTHVLDDAGIVGILDEAQPDVEAIRRGNRTFVIHHGNETVTVSIDGSPVQLEPQSLLLMEAPR